jgi:tetratricopeptide (TPR) repeat protein
VYEQLGDVRDHVGAYQDAATAYRAARRITPREAPVDEARLVLKLARMHGWLDRFPLARRWIRRGLRMIGELGDAAAVSQRAELAVWYAHFCAEEGRHQLAMRWCERAIADAETVTDRPTLARAHRVLGRIHGSLGDPQAATEWIRALELYTELDDLDGQAAMTNNLGALAYWDGRWGAAREHFARSLEICRRIGDEDGAATAQKNLGQVLGEQGRLAEAGDLLSAALRTWQAAGHRANVARAQRELAWIATRSGDHARATALLEAAHSAFQGVGAEGEDVDTLAVVAESLLLRGEAAQALHVVEGALEHDLALGGVSASNPLLHRLRGHALERMGAADEARRAYDASLQAAQTREMDYELALTLRALADLATTGAPGAEDLDAEELTAASRTILDRLDVVWLPDIPRSPAAVSGS